jgi:alkanesulfonate monooxygenase SsuD/methylene tetrahydromethanopterin reductase-like flavin-dependent oxidoreductase (luciferase family)
MAAPLKIGLNLVWVRPDVIVECAQLAEQLGYDSLWSGEHVALQQEPNWWRLFPGMEALGDAASVDRVPFRSESPFLDPMIVLAHLAAVTKRAATRGPLGRLVRGRRYACAF